MNSLTAPAKNIAENAGIAGDVVISKVKEGKDNFGYNALTGEYGDLVKDMVIDPKKVTRSALEYASSVAAMFLTLEVASPTSRRKTNPRCRPEEWEAWEISDRSDRKRGPAGPLFAGKKNRQDPGEGTGGFGTIGC